jgi:hypothetical protein
MSARNALEWGLNLAEHKPEPLKVVNINGWKYYADEDRSIAPYFTNLLLQRVNAKKACNTLVVGEPGVWKSYCCAQLCRVLDPRFTVNQIVYNYSKYYEVLLDKRYRQGSPIFLDEPQDYISNREWFKDVQQALVKSITSQRFLVRPLFVAIISANLIDITIRKYLTQFQIECTDRGVARVEQVSPAFREDKVYYHKICDLHYGLMENGKCNRDSCLDCDKLEICMLFRAKYERQKRDVQMPKYAQLEQQARARESKELTIEQIGELAYPLRAQYQKPNGEIDTKKLRLALRMCDSHVIVSANKSYDVKTFMEYRYRNDFKGNT